MKLEERFVLFGKAPDLDWSPALTAQVLNCSIRRAQELHKSELEIHRQISRQIFEKIYE